METKGIYISFSFLPLYRQFDDMDSPTHQVQVQVLWRHLHHTHEGWWRWALVSLDGEAPSQMVGLSASVNLPLHHKVQKFSSGTTCYPGGPGNRAIKRLWWCGVVLWRHWQCWLAVSCWLDDRQYRTTSEYWVSRCMSKKLCRQQKLSLG